MSKASNPTETASACCSLCCDPEYANKVTYKCTTILSKYFPLSESNTAPGWYKGTVTTHNLSKDEDDVECIWNEIHYADGDIENFPQEEMQQYQIEVWQSPDAEPAACKEGGGDNKNPASSSTNDSSYDQKWQDRLEQLKKFKEETGHTRVTKTYDASLAHWVSKQRSSFKREYPLMSIERIQKLNEIGFEWSVGHARSCSGQEDYSHSGRKPNDQKWQSMFDQLKKFKEETGHIKVPKNYKDPSLYYWVRNQCTFYRRENPPMLAHRKEKLEEIGIEQILLPPKQSLPGFNGRISNDAKWELMFGQLKEFKAEKGHIKVPRNSEDPALTALHHWVKNQRVFYKKANNPMPAKRIQRLQELGVDWGQPGQNLPNPDRKTNQEKWEIKFNLLKNFKAEYGHCRVPQNYRDSSLATWVVQQRVRYKHKKSMMPTEYIQMLNEIGFVWALKKGKASNNMSEKEEEANSHDGAVAKSPAEPTPETTNAKARTQDQKWMDGYARLKDFKTKTGHCGGPTLRTEDPFLFNWVATQRSQYKKNNTPLPTERTRLLNEIGFEWVHQDQRLKRIEQICPQTGAVVAQYNSVKEGAKAVGIFSTNISVSLASGTTVVAGFRWRFFTGPEDDWKPIAVDGALSPKGPTRKEKSTAFEDNIKALLEFKEKHGHMNVPQQSGGNLGRFVDNMRQEYKAFQKGATVRGTPLNEARIPLLQQRFERLKEVGFHFNPGDAKEGWEERVAELISFKEKNGNCNVKKRDGSLGRWVHNIRTRYKDCKRCDVDPVLRERLHQLDMIGFSWQVKSGPRKKCQATEESESAAAEMETTEVEYESVEV